MAVNWISWLQLTSETRAPVRTSKAQNASGVTGCCASQSVCGSAWGPATVVRADKLCQFPAGCVLRFRARFTGMAKLNSKQLFLAALQGLPVPRVPVAPLTAHFCARVGGVSLNRYTGDAGTLAECVIRTWEKFRPDAIFVSAD